VSYLPELQRILYEGALRLEHEELEAAGVPAARDEQQGSRLSAALRWMRSRRFFILIAVGLLAGGTAAAAIIALNARRSAAPTGALHSQAGFGSDLEVTSGGYAVSVTPALRGGTVGLCVSEQDHESALVPIGDPGALRAALNERRTQINASLAAGGSAAAGSRAALTRDVDVVIPQLLVDLGRPVGVRESQAFLGPYGGLFGSSGGGASSCGVAAQAGDPIIGSFGEVDKSSGGRSRPITTSTLVVITTRAVAAVRVSPTLTLLTRPDRQLPDGYRITIAVEQSVGSRPQLPIGSGAPPLVPLDASGKRLPEESRPPLVGDHAVYWRPAGHGAPPAGACEIGTGTLSDARVEFGVVVPTIQAFPQLIDKTFLSCASTSFFYRGSEVTAAILLDAQHPGAPPTSLPLSAPASGAPGVLTESTSLSGGGQSIAARRIGDAWLIVDSSGRLATRLTILRRLTVCVRVNGACR
jgi:hypothetical protein